MNRLAQQAVATQIAVTGFVLGAFDRMRSDQRGQGSVEYIGIIVVVVAIIGAIVGFATPIGTAIKDKLVAAVNSLTVG